MYRSLQQFENVENISMIFSFSREFFDYYECEIGVLKVWAFVFGDEQSFLLEI